MTYSFLCFEFLWGYEGIANEPATLIHFYGVTIRYWFFGVVTASLRKDTHGR